MPFVESLGVAGDGVNQDCPDAGNVGCLQSAQHSVTQKPLAQAVAVKFAINGKSTNNHGWNGIRHVAPDAAGSAGVRDCSNGQRIIGYHSQA